MDAAPKPGCRKINLPLALHPVHVMMPSGLWIRGTYKGSHLVACLAHWMNLRAFGTAAFAASFCHCTTNVRARAWPVRRTHVALSNFILLLLHSQTVRLHEVAILQSGEPLQLPPVRALSNRNGCFPYSQTEVSLEQLNPEAQTLAILRSKPLQA